MESISAEWDVIQLLEKELDNRPKDEFKGQLDRLKEAAQSIERRSKARESDDDIHNAMSILCQDLGILWRDVFLIND